MGKGAADQDYQGHRFWDTEMYMNPAVLMFRPNTVKKMLQYRTMYAEQAQRKAEVSAWDRALKFGNKLDSCFWQHFYPFNNLEHI